MWQFSAVYSEKTYPDWEAVSLAGRQTLTVSYWTETLEVTDADMEYLYSVMLEDEKPLTSRDAAKMFIERRIRQEEDKWRKRLSEGKLFQPKEQYETGDRLVFSAFDFQSGVVVSSRPGASLDHGAFTAMTVELEDGTRREVASGLASDHVLNLSEDSEDLTHLFESVDASEVYARFGNKLRRLIEARFEDEEDAAYGAGLWFLKSLLPEVGIGHINLAEAILDMNGGGPLGPEDILPILDLPQEINPNLQAFALNYALYHEDRFDEVGAEGRVRWYLKRLEPEEVKTTPERLVYTDIPYNRDLLGAESVALEAEIKDELSDLAEPESVPEKVTLTLIYPHRRAGTLPLTPELSAMFPTAYEAERIRITLVDEQTGEEYDGWVVRAGRYVVGLDRFYRAHRLPIGVFVHIKRTDDPERFLIDFDEHRPRTEWIRLIVPQNNQITFENHKRSIGAGYDDLVVLGTDDLKKVDAIWDLTMKRRRSIVEIIRELLPELARLNPQSAVHAKTLYSAVNVIRRCPPGPILAALESQPEFQPVGGNYWRYSKNS
jgi:hypothetical protein